MSGTEARAAIIREYKKPFSIEDVQIEGPRENEVLVRLVSSGICHTDMVFQGGEGFAVPTPCVLGHEGAGVVEEVGSSVTSVEPGDHVILSVLSCRQCDNCKRGLPTYCQYNAQLNYSGGRGCGDGSSPVSQDGERINAAFFGQSSFANYALADQRNTVKVDKRAPLELLGPLSCGFQTGVGAVINSIGLKKGETLAIFGGGAVGLSALLAAIDVGASATVVIEPVAERRELALELGATHVVDPTGKQDVADEVKKLTGGGTTHAIDTTGNPGVVATAAQVLLVTGTLCTAGIPPFGTMLPIDMLDIMVRGIAVRGNSVGDGDPQIMLPMMVNMFLDGRLPIDKLIKTFPFNQINEAFAASKDGSAVKATLTFG
jgi:Zn-dependent alcohol dehydrogenase